jgi:hypothetical protein
MHATDCVPYNVIDMIWNSTKKKICERVKEEVHYSAEKIYQEEWKKMIMDSPMFSISQFAEVSQTFYTLKSTFGNIRLKTRPPLPKRREDIYIDMCLTLDAKKPFLVYQADKNR